MWRTTPTTNLMFWTIESHKAVAFFVYLAFRSAPKNGGSLLNAVLRLRFSQTADAKAIFNPS